METGTGICRSTSWTSAHSPAGLARRRKRPSHPCSIGTWLSAIPTPSLNPTWLPYSTSLAITRRSAPMNSAKTFRASLCSPSAALGVLACYLGFGLLGSSTQVIERLPPAHLHSPPDVSVAVNPPSATADLGGPVHFAPPVTAPPAAHPP